MSQLRSTLEEYLSIRRSLGFVLREPARCLRHFVAFAEKEGASHITTALALRWVKQATNVEPATRACRLGMIRRFAAWCSTNEPLTEVPPDGLLPHRYSRTRPYIYSDNEIVRIIQAAGDLPSSKGLRAHTYSCLFGLLAVTGMRVSEAVALEQEDVDIREGILTIRRTKFGKSRFIPVHPSTCDILDDYSDTRDRVFSVPLTKGFFVSERGTTITAASARCTFAKVSQQIGLRAPAMPNRSGCGPRLHDMRHRFAVQTLIHWYRAGLDVERQLPKLSTYLGHVHINDTYWYIEAVPELLGLATQRLVDKHQEVGT